MKHFTIDKENNITFHASHQEAKGTDGVLFSTEKQFADAIGNDNKRLLEVWNSLPGVKPVAKFANRKAATERIWKAIQNLAGPVATKPAPRRHRGGVKSETPPTVAPPAATEPQAVASLGADVADVAPTAAKATKKAARTKKASTANPQAKAAGKPSKTDTILHMLTQPSGASLQALMNATGWQAHSVCGFISGTLGKKMGLTVASSKAENGERRYSIAS